MTRIELIDLGQKIVAAKGTESQIDAMMDLFDKNVPHPNGSNLFFYPENYNARIDDLSKYRPSVEEVVDQCLSYKPIQL
ncbi:bacteriocin immunity protein [Muricauda sp. 334s03]|uniref:Bacteriocin immunity protein n=1 Tax=Flagellimonas yonaguniensis TaxID=3031325 RepID=A0ABT5Y3I2_9FLAO|nr:bacteriocin immunity protein [[Muricauda] yonaguniensis]MDF0717899.1 bacteriocin immunity protein [[Muricauda] yonaguniensis]